MAESAVKKLAEALQEMATWAATGRDHYAMIFDPARKLSDKLRNARDEDPDVAEVVSKTFQEMAKPKAYLRQIASGFDERYKNLEKAKAAFESAVARAKKR